MTLSQRGLSANMLKLIAIVAMAIDHIGAIFYPETALFRIIGRLTMPIMAFFIAEGYHYTKDLKKYMLRLLLFGLITMVPYAYYFGYGPFNIMFSLLAGLIAITGYDRSKTGLQRVISLLIPMLVATALQFDGQFIVVFLIFVFHRHRNQPKIITLQMMMLYAVIEAMLISATPGPLTFHVWVQLFALLALPLIFNYKGDREPPVLPKYTFYLFYPVHITLLLLLKIMLLA